METEARDKFIQPRYFIVFRVDEKLYRITSHSYTQGVTFIKHKKLILSKYVNVKKIELLTHQY